MKNKERVYWIDIAKGIATLLVVVLHVNIIYQDSGLYLDKFLYNYPRRFIIHFSMPFFMIISGFLLFKSRKTNSVKNRILQVLCNYGIPYIFFTLLFTLIQMIASKFIATNNHFSFKNLLQCLYDPIGFTWFLYALLIFHLICIIIPVERWKWLHLTVSVIFFVSYPYVKDFLGSSIFSHVFKYYLYFMIGYCFNGLIVKLQEKSKIVYLLFIPSGILLFGINYLFYKEMLVASPLISQLILFVSGISGSVFFMILSIFIKRSPVLEEFGRHSLVVYGLHPIVISFCRIVLTKLHLNTPSGVLPLLVCTFFGAVIPLLVYRLSTKVGKLDFFFYPGKYLKFNK